MKKLKVLILLILIITSLFLPFTLTVSGKNSGDYTEINIDGDTVTLLDYNSNQLIMNGSTGAIVFFLNGRRFPLCIENADSDSVANTSAKNDMRSLITVQYADESSTRFNSNSYVASILRKTYKVKTSADKKSVLIELEFSREKEQFTVPISFSFEKNSLVAAVNYEGIVEKGTTKILSIRLLPYFFSGRKTDSGYVIVPDGSGMGINFGSNVKGEYSAQIFDDDPTLTKREQVGTQQSVYVPVIGIVGDGYAGSAYIRSGEANAFVYAQSAGTKNDLTSVGFGFDYRQMDLTVLADKAWNEREVYKISEFTNKTNPEVVINFLFNEEAQPAGIASVYRNYLLENGKIKKRENKLPCVFEVFGAVKKQKSFLGIPFYSTVTSTTIKDVENMISKFSDAGCDNSIWTLYGFLKNGIYGNNNSVAKIDGSVGTKKSYKTLVKSASEKNADIILAADLQKIYGTGYFARRNASKKMDTSYANGYFYKRSINSAEKNFSWFFTKQSHLLKNSQKFLKGFSSLGGGIALCSAGDELYSDYSSGYETRTDTMNQLIKQSEMLSEKVETVWQTGANSYLAGVSDGILNAPSKSSGYEIESFELPFYSLIFKGALPMASTPVNADNSNVEMQRLKNIETGMLPHYRVTYDSPKIYNDTKLNFLLNTRYTECINDCSVQYKEFKEIHGELKNSDIISYTLEDGLRKVVYRNGTTIFINFDSKPHSHNEITVCAMDYTVIKD